MSSHPPESEAELIEMIRAIDARAPEDLHRRTEALVAERSGRTRRAPGRLGAGAQLRLGGSLALLAVAAIVLALIFTGGASAPPSVREVAAAALRAAVLPAPGESTRERSKLTADVEGVAFPYWAERFGWRTSGARSDRVGGRLVRTVFYTDDRGRRVGYAILAGAAPPAPSAGSVRWLGGTPYRLLMENGQRTVVWLRKGRLCVVAGRGVSDATLLRLASWREPGVS